MTLEEFQENIKNLPNSEIIESLKLKECDFEPGIYELYLTEAKNRNVDISSISPDNKLLIGKEIAPIWKRIINYLIDLWIVFGTIILIFSNSIKNTETSPVFVFIIGTVLYISYFLFFEYKFGKSLGKLITGTTVLTVELEKPTFNIIVKRTISRFIPLNTWFCLFSGKSLHERISNTRCFNDSYLKSLDTHLGSNVKFSGDGA